MKKRAANNLLMRALRDPVRALTKPARLYRRWTFNRAPADAVLRADGRETFFVAGSDRGVGRWVYVNREPADFQKFETAFRLLGKPAPLELLIDVGANIGTICIPAVKRGYFQRAIAVEPAPRNFALLSKNISANGLDGRIVPHNVALAAVSGATLTFELSDNNFGDHRVRMNGSVGSYGEAARKTISVKTETLDNLAPGIDPKSTLIWMDTQGFEGHVLSGARAALAQRTPICMEFWAYGLDYSGGFSLLKECLIGNRYDRVYDVDEPTQPPQPASAETLDRLYEKYRDPRKAADLVVM